MNPEMLVRIFEIASAIAMHIYRAVVGNDTEELRRLSDVWPVPIQSKIALLAIEARARNDVKEG
jgi:hypothetical protein